MEWFNLAKPGPQQGRRSIISPEGLTILLRF